ncbi:hypothetical protein BX661DRAFT_97260 [Kickxella alabastrina]|uniref:uncharacterized protein n=1 Tax=Kickxella alabastrina TaxID=61397 RepID=UPI0022210CE4|nr:uncharacterized protein BX661DRAFT_97260 [Kickxella alabastrina]KAI7830113.1 hypothetical protein BX661DRAFT_97260 [Kickxella alabastrina]
MKKEKKNWLIKSKKKNKGGCSPLYVSSPSFTLLHLLFSFLPFLFFFWDATFSRTTTIGYTVACLFRPFFCKNQEKFKERRNMPQSHEVIAQQNYLYFSTLFLSTVSCLPIVPK